MKLLYSTSACTLLVVSLQLALGSHVFAQQAPRPAPSGSAPAKTAQDIPPDLLVRNQPVFVRTEAYAGSPLGIGRISFRLRAGDEIILQTGATGIREASNRILYPVLTKSPARQFFQSITGSSTNNPDELHTFWFLFKGDKPLSISLVGTDFSHQVVPIAFAKPNKFARQLKRWWNEFTRAVHAQSEDGDYPSVVETYLLNMISRRLGLEVPEIHKPRKDLLTQTFELLFDVETLRLDEIRRAMTGLSDYQEANIPLPQPIQWSPVRVGNLPETIPIEPIAKAVPEECFYLRFGTWQNQIWLQRLMEEYGGDLGRMVAIRGYTPRLQTKFLDQLAIESSEWDVLFGGNLIDDVAIIGTDTYFDEGAAVGVLLHAKNTSSLKSNLLTKRKRFVRQNKEAGVDMVELAHNGETIYFLKTADNRYRSFYVTVGDHHLVTTSFTIAKRFVESVNGIGSLADSEEFQYARVMMPLEREDTVFLYLSTMFFQGLLSPHYQVELRRRNRVITDMQLLDVASFAARSEGIDPNNLEKLIRDGFLPSGFGNRPDQSTFSTDGKVWHDSIRGRRGFFTPIPDLNFAGVTRDEAAWFTERAVFFAENMSTLDPMLVGIKRYQRSEDIERVIFDGRIAPFGQEKYGWLISMLGEPLVQKIVGSPDDIITFHASLRGSSQIANVPSHQIFGAVQDRLDPGIDLQPSTALKMLKTLREIPGYIGGWPAPGYLDWLPSGLGQEPDQHGYTHARLLGLWRLQWGDFSVVSFQRDRLEELKKYLRNVPAERPAHIRLKVNDLVGSRLESWANAINYRRSWQTSISNVKLLNSLIQQFRLEPEIARAVAERILNVDLVCSLGGEYQVYETPSGRKIWASNAWPSFSDPQMPADYSSPVLSWFRGTELEVTKADSQFVVHGFINIQRQAEEPAINLPGLELFKGFGSFLSGEKKPDSPPGTSGGNQ